MLVRLLKMLQVLNLSGFWIWYCCICKGYLFSSAKGCRYGSVCLSNAWILLNVPQYASPWLILLNVSEYAWIYLRNCFDYARVLNVPHHLIYLTVFWKCLRYEICRVWNILWQSYNNIVNIVANVIILEFLFARFVHPGTPQLAILFFFYFGQNVMINLQNTFTLSLFSLFK